MDDSQQMCLALELDQGTVEQKRWQRKVQGLVAATKGPYQERFHTSSLTVAVVTTRGEKRLADLVRWTESALGERERDAADLFRLAAFNPATTDPAGVFFSPIWRRPLHDQAVALFPAAELQLTTPTRGRP